MVTRRNHLPTCVPDEQKWSGSFLLRLLSLHPQGVLLACFFCSGATGLVYEVVWARRLTLSFGVTVLAYSTVLAAFLGGLAAGSLIFGRVVDRWGYPLRLYALLEGAVGLFCFSTPALFAQVERIYLAIYPAIGEQVWPLRLARFGLAAAVMFVPTALMGGTLPVLSRAKVRRLEEIGTGIGLLYGVNTLGAVSGAAAAGFFLLPTVGLRGSIYCAAVVNLAIGLVAYALHLTQGEKPPVFEHNVGNEPEETVRRGPYAVLLVAYGFSGAAALIYEVVWTRVLALAFGTSVYAFSGMLAAFLAGLALGGLVPAAKRLAWVDRLRDPTLSFGLVQVTIAILVTVLTPLLDRLPLVFIGLFKVFGPRFWALQLGGLGISFLVMLPAAALMGFAFPLVTRISTEHVRALGRRLSAVYAANTVGTVVGSFVAGFVLIPLIGTRWALAVGVAINGLVGLAYLLPTLRRQTLKASIGLAAAALCVVAWTLMPEWNRYVLSSGAYVYADYYLARGPSSTMHEKELLYYRDALTATLSVTRVTAPGLQKPIVSLQINGKTDASTADLSTQLVLGHLPLLLAPEPRSVLVIGLASGCTLGAVEQHDGIERIACVEIEPAMKHVAGFFREINRDCLNDPRVRLIINDARNHVLVSEDRYDVLTSEPSNPWIAGMANLFTLEHFQLCRDRMKPKGVFCQWLPIYNLAPDDFACIVATFRRVFPHSSLWIFPDMPSDAYLIGSQGPLMIDVVELARRAARPGIASDLEEAKLRDVWDLLGGYLLSTEVLDRAAPNAPLNTDDFPRLEFSAPLRLYTTEPQATLLQVLQLGANADLPLGRAGVASNEGYRSALGGLFIRAPWIVRGEGLKVSRDVGAYVRGSRLPPAEALLTISCQVMTSDADILIARQGELQKASGQSALPQSPPSRIIRAAGRHRVSVWIRPSGEEGIAWVAHWMCPEQEREYFVRCRKGAPSPIEPEKALAALVCEHGRSEQ